jgi:hypothetical protein
MAELKVRFCRVLTTLPVNRRMEQTRQPACAKTHIPLNIQTANRSRGRKSVTKHSILIAPDYHSLSAVEARTPKSGDVERSSIRLGALGLIRLGLEL